jgi:hypothetical protein
LKANEAAGAFLGNFRGTLATKRRAHFGGSALDVLRRGWAKASEAEREAFLAENRLMRMGQ